MPPSKLESRLTMIAVDTNVLVRLVVRDDDVQARRAAAFATFDKRLKKRADTVAPGRHVQET